MNSKCFSWLCLILSMVWVLTNGLTNDNSDRFELNEKDFLHENIHQDPISHIPIIGSIKTCMEYRRSIIRLQQIVRGHHHILHVLVNQTLYDINLQITAIQSNFTHDISIRSKRNDLIQLILGILIIVFIILTIFYHFCHRPCLQQKQIAALVEEKHLNKSTNECITK